MNQIARCDWLPERARWSHLARSGLPAVSRKQNFTKSHIINPLLTKFVRSRWLDIGFVSVHKHAKKELGQYPAILTSHLVNNPYKLRLYARQPGKALNGLNVVRNFHRISTERFFQPFWQYLMFLEKCRAITKIFVRLQDDKISQLGHSTGKLVSAFNDTSKIHAYIGS